MSKLGNIDKVVRIVLFLLAFFMIYVGVATMFLPLEPAGGELGFIFSNRIPLVLFGLVFSITGLSLLYGKIRRRRRVVSRALMATFLCFLFGALINGISVGWVTAAWLPNLVVAIFVGGLWLWWRLRTEYIDMGEIRDLRRSLKEHREAS